MQFNSLLACGEPKPSTTRAASGLNLPNNFDSLKEINQQFEGLQLQRCVATDGKIPSKLRRSSIKVKSPWMAHRSSNLFTGVRGIAIFRVVRVGGNARIGAVRGIADTQVAVLGHPHRPEHRRAPLPIL